MGGHAVRYYGLQRYTNDFDFTLAPDGWENLADRLARTNLFPKTRTIEGNSWRPLSFRRFLLEALANGQEEWLEFWRSNHLLAPFAELLDRREVAKVAGTDVAFLGLSDLIRSKETERAKDWEDIVYLEQFFDLRHRSQHAAGRISLAEAIGQLRSQAGFDALLADSALSDQAAVRVVLEQIRNPITQAFLLPCAPDSVLSPAVPPIEPLVDRKLRSIPPGSPLHRTLVEVVRRQYKLGCQNRDRADKETIASSLGAANRPS
jgi:hypothetical protein